jgi:acetaldehyde dehydrogenase (acetylating)
LSREKLSPILAFYSAANLAAGIEICTKLLQYGGMGHTASIHSQNESAVKQFGLAIPAFRVVVNTSAVHGSIGYSTNLFPAMTLGCGSHGGNITSDNIGPQHLMNIKRVAWESRAVEHRTIPASQRLSGSAPVPALGPLTRIAGAEPRAQERESEKVAVAFASSESVKAGAAAGSAGGVPDRQTIARIIEQVFAARGISRGGPAKAESPSASTASHLAAAAWPVTSATTAALPAAMPEPPPTHPPGAPARSEAPPAPVIEVVEFVSENDARSAVARSQKIFIGPKTIVTPSARDFGDAHDLFVVTDIVPKPTRRYPD